MVWPSVLASVAQRDASGARPHVAGGSPAEGRVTFRRAAGHGSSLRALPAGVWVVSAAVNPMCAQVLVCGSAPNSGSTPGRKPLVT